MFIFGVVFWLSWENVFRFMNVGREIFRGWKILVVFEEFIVMFIFLCDKLLWDFIIELCLLLSIVDLMFFGFVCLLLVLRLSFWKFLDMLIVLCFGIGFCFYIWNDSLFWMFNCVNIGEECCNFCFFSMGLVFLLVIVNFGRFWSFFCNKWGSNGDDFFLIFFIIG